MADERQPDYREPTDCGEPDASWSIAQIGDLNGDGKSDLLWRQSGSGTLAEWTMNGSDIASSQTIAAAPDSSWQVQSKPTNYAV
jgi:hypothetical protein